MLWNGLAQHAVTVVEDTFTGWIVQNWTQNVDIQLTMPLGSSASTAVRTWRRSINLQHYYYYYIRDT
jgi:hypothetical protein